MPPTKVIFYREPTGATPVLDWLRDLKDRDRRSFAKCVVRINRLAESGHELRRPEADYLRDGIYELRARRGTINYRILYFFHGRGACVLAHALTKKDKVPERDVELAILRMTMFEADPGEHSHGE